jgi:hypothetical protein
VREWTEMIAVGHHDEAVNSPGHNADTNWSWRTESPSARREHQIVMFLGNISNTAHSSGIGLVIDNVVLNH